MYVRISKKYRMCFLNAIHSVHTRVGLDFSKIRDFGRITAILKYRFFGEKLKMFFFFLFSNGNENDLSLTLRISRL